jgi:DNA-binding CsgD family transcriptional regulator
VGASLDQHTDGPPTGVTFESLLASSPVRHSAGEDGKPPAGHLWSSLPRELAAVFRPLAADVAGEILTEIQQLIPEYARPLNGQFGKSITDGIQYALLQFIDRLGDPGARQDDRARLFRHLGSEEVYAGRTIDALQTAYRIGARIAWRRMAESSQRAGVQADTLCLLAEAVFAYIDELSALSVDGYTAAQASAAGTRERRRRRLLELILADPPAAPQAIAELAEAAGWELPEQVAVVALEREARGGELCIPALDAEVLMDLEGNEPCLVVAAGDLHLLRDPENTLPGWRAAVGPTSTLAKARQSHRWALRAISLVRKGVLPPNPVTWCAEHLSTLWLVHDKFLVNELARHCLAPLSGLTPKQRTRLAQTLLAWLETRGNTPEIASRLKVHPQTVRNRLRQLEELFGDRLGDPDERFDMEIALRAMRTPERAVVA